MAEKLDDLDLSKDLDIGELSAASDPESESPAEPTTPSTESQVSSPDTPLKTDPRKATDDDYKDVVKRLKAYTAKDETWISIPRWDENGEYLGERGVELADATGEEFYEWLCHVYPPSAKLKHSAETYEELETRKKTWHSVKALIKHVSWPQPGVD
jgi:hypothetical protein